MGSPPGPGYGMSSPYGAAYNSSGGPPYNNPAPYGMMNSGNMINNPMGSMGVMGMGNNLALGMGSAPSNIPTPGANHRLGPGITDPRANEWKLFVGQVPFDCFERELWPMFAELGEVLELVILRWVWTRARIFLIVLAACSMNTKSNYLSLGNFCLHPLSMSLVCV